MTHIELSDIFDKIQGVIIGKFTGIEDKTYINEPKSVMEIVKDKLSKYKFPVMYNVDFGHASENITLPVGGIIYFNADKRVIEMSSKVVK